MGKRYRLLLICLWCLVGLGIVSIVVYTSRQSILVGLGEWLNVGESPDLCDCAVVLPGGPDSRPFVAAGLVKVGFAEHVILLQTKTRPDIQSGVARPTHLVERDVLLRCGVRSDQIITLATESDSTFADACALRDYLDSNPGTTVNIVTSDFHTRRARWVFRQVLGSRARNTKFVAATSERVPSTLWWKHKTAITVYTGEFVKLAYYWLRYSRTPYWIAAIALVIGWRIWRRSVPPAKARATARLPV